MIDNEQLSQARTRLSPDDAAVFDAALGAIQRRDGLARDVVEWALSRAGMVKGPDEAALLFPHDDQRWALAYLLDGRTSTCAIAREGELEASGAMAPWRGVPYARRIGTALSAEIGFAKREGAWTSAERWEPGGTLWDMGDGVVIGSSGAGYPGLWAIGEYSGAHIFTALHVEGDVAHSIDGGQGAPADIALRSRVIVEACGELWLAHVGAGVRHDGRPNRGRRVYGWSRVAELPVRQADTEPAPPPES